MERRVKVSKSGIVTSALLLYALGAPLIGGSLIGGFLVVNSAWLDAHAEFMVWGGAILGTLLTSLALMPSILLGAILGFYSKGSMLGLGLAALSIGIAAAIGIWLGKLLSNAHVNKMLEAKPHWRQWFDQVQNKQGKALLITVFLARLSPHMPFSATNLLLAQLSFSSMTLTLVSWLGLLPRTVIAALAGSTLSGLSEWREMKPVIPFDSLIMGVLLILLVYIVYRAVTRQARNEAARRDQEGSPPQSR